MKEQYAAKNIPNVLAHMATLAHFFYVFLAYPSGPTYRTPRVPSIGPEGYAFYVKERNAAITL